MIVLHYIGVDCDTEFKSTGKEKTRVLPDRNIITVGAKRFRCGEEASGFHDTSFDRFLIVILTSARSCTPMSCRQMAHPFPRDWWSHEMRRGVFQPYLLVLEPADFSTFFTFCVTLTSARILYATPPTRQSQGYRDTPWLPTW